MVNNNQPPSCDQIVLEYLNGGVTFRQLAAEYGLNRMTICHWVHQQQGLFCDRTKEYQKQKSTKHKGDSTLPLVPPSAPVPAPSPPPNPLVEPLRQAQLKIALLEEVIRIAQDEHGLLLPKKFSTKQSRPSGSNKP